MNGWFILTKSCSNFPFSRFPFSSYLHLFLLFLLIFLYILSFLSCSSYSSFICCIPSLYLILLKQLLSSFLAFLEYLFPLNLTCSTIILDLWYCLRQIPPLQSKFNPSSQWSPYQFCNRQDCWLTSNSPQLFWTIGMSMSNTPIQIQSQFTMVPISILQYRRSLPNQHEETPLLILLQTSLLIHLDPRIPVNPSYTSNQVRDSELFVLNVNSVVAVLFWSTVLFFT